MPRQYVHELLLEVPGGVKWGEERIMSHGQDSVKAMLYKMYYFGMTSVTLSQFRSQQSDYIAAAQREPVEITSRGAGRRAVVVSPEFYDRAVAALEDLADARAAAEARVEQEPRVTHEDLRRELGI